MLLLVLLLVILCYYYYSSEHMTGEEIYNSTNGHMKHSYNEFQDMIPEGHIVNYYDLRNLDKNGKYTPDNIKSVM